MHKLGFIFDMDGTMIDSMGYHAKSWALFCEAHGLTHPLPKVLQMTTGRTCVACMILLFGRPVVRQEALDYVHHKESLYRDLFESEFREVKGFKAFIAHITERGLPWAMGTAGDKIPASSRTAGGRDKGVGAYEVIGGLHIPDPFRKYSFRTPTATMSPASNFRPPASMHRSKQRLKSEGGVLASA